MNFKDYTTAAINRFGLTGNAALADELGLSKSAISHFTSGKATPSESTMIKLAELAGIPKEEALIDLNLWRSKNNPELQKVWQRVSKMIVKICLAGVICADISSGCTPPTPQVEYEQSPRILCIMENFI